MIEPLQRLLAPDVLAGLTTRPLPELRDLRVQCSDVEADISLVRRLAQGRLDILGHEIRRRSGDGADEGGLGATGLLMDLPDLMTDAPRPGKAPRGRPVNIGEPGPVALQLVERLDSVAPPGALAAVGGVGDAELRETFEVVRGFELELSTVRRRLHERIDAIQSEIGRRYRDGEASIDSLLS